jgi:putative addiction module killer protein
LEAGFSESRIDFGSGYRVYYGMDGDEVILLSGGNKSTQDADIVHAGSTGKITSDEIARGRGSGNETTGGG